MKKILISLVILLAISFSFAQKTYVELILDASGSMWNKLDDGRYRITAAKDVLTSFVSGLPTADLNVGLRVYGSEISALEDNACEDSKLFVELDGVDKSSLTQTVQNAKAIGATPIAISLLAAADDFPTDAEKRLIILVTDGEESCGGDLQAVAADLKARGFDIDIRIIGFDLDQRAIDSFKGIGSFENAQNAEQLAQALDTAVEEVVVEEVVENDCSLEATIDAPAQTEASYPFSLSFSGPEGRLSLHPKGGDKYSALASVYSAENKAEILAPGEIGDYELRYTANAGDCVIATRDLKVIPTQVTLVPPAEVEASFDFVVEFAGPEGYIGIYEKTATGRNDDITFFHTGWTNPSLTAPSELGTYEVRYYDSNGVLLKAVDINILESQASISPPAEVEASFEFTVPFSGPEGYVGIYEKTAKGKDNNITYFYTGWTNPSLTAPSEAGIYEIRYYDSENNLMASKDITVTSSQASISPPAEVEASFEFTVPFSGPEGYVGIYEKTATGRNDDITFFYTGWTNPSLTAPSEAGIYEIRYYDSENNLMASKDITVTASTASITPPAMVEAGYAFNVEFSGPEGYVGIYELSSTDKNDKLGYFVTKWGDVAVIGAPVNTGNYEIRFYDTESNLLVSKPIIVTASKATLTVPDSVASGTEFTIPYDGPAGYVGIYKLDASSRNDDIDYHVTAWGKPAKLDAPEQAGAYEIRYYASPKNGTEGLLLSLPITVK